MWRAFFLAIGLSVFLLGAECLVIEQAVLHPSRRANAQQASSLSGEPEIRTVLRPPEWVPWTFMSAGAVTVLYALTLPRRQTG
ncbi:MAG: hypothetical protein KatS3mg110_4035 [Pirellulaceae bacterium]|nr:MAG: hypothetical protein KatS3mg110_4035 [Pirellulaceae bacterium]